MARKEDQPYIREAKLPVSVHFTFSSRTRLAACVKNTESISYRDSPGCLYSLLLKRFFLRLDWRHLCNVHRNSLHAIKQKLALPLDVLRMTSFSFRCILAMLCKECAVVMTFCAGTCTDTSASSHAPALRIGVC